MLVKLNSIKILLLAQPTAEAPSENVTFAELEELTTFKVVNSYNFYGCMYNYNIIPMYRSHLFKLLEQSTILYLF